VAYCRHQQYKVRVCARQERLIADTKHHHLLSAPSDFSAHIGIPIKLCYNNYVEWTVDGIETRTFRDY